MGHYIVWFTVLSICALVVAFLLVKIIGHNVNLEMPLPEEAKWYHKSWRWTVTKTHLHSNWYLSYGKGLIKLGLVACLIYFGLPYSCNYLKVALGDGICLDNKARSQLSDGFVGDWNVQTYHDDFACRWYADILSRVAGWNDQYPEKTFINNIPGHQEFMSVYNDKRRILYTSVIEPADREPLLDNLMLSDHGHRRLQAMLVRLYSYWFDRERGDVLFDEDLGNAKAFENGRDVTLLVFNAMQVDADQDGQPNETDEYPLDHHNGSASPDTTTTELNWYKLGAKKTIPIKP